MQPSTDVAPAEGEADGGALGQHAIARIAVDLEDAGKAREATDRLLGLAVGRVQVGDAGRVRSTLGPVVPCKGEELSGLRRPPRRDRAPCARLVGEQLGRCLQPLEQPRCQCPRHQLAATGTRVSRASCTRRHSKVDELDTVGVLRPEHVHRAGELIGAHRLAGC